MSDASVLTAEGYLDDIYSRHDRSKIYTRFQKKRTYWGPKDLHLRHKKVILMYASGMRIVDIAKEIGFHVQTVTRIVNSELGQQMIAKIYEETAHSAVHVKQILDTAAPMAARNLVRIIDGQEPASTKELLDASKDLLDRAGFGKVQKTQSVVAHLTGDDIEAIKTRARAAKQLTTEDGSLIEPDGSETDGDEGS